MTGLFEVRYLRLEEHMRLRGLSHQNSNIKPQITILLCALCVLCGFALPARAAEKATIVLNWVPEPEFGGIYAAKESGAFAKHNLDVAIKPGGAGAPTWQQVASGKA